MAKVVLVWNEHPTEVVAGFHARKVAQILREKYGHEVIVEKVPLNNTNYGIVRKKSALKAAFGLDLLSTSSEKALWYRLKHGAPTFNFHASHYEIMGRAGDQSLTPEDFQLTKMRFKERGKKSSEIGIDKGILQNYLVEMPAYFETLPVKKASARLAKLAKVARLTDEYEDCRSIYHLERTPLNHPRQKRFLSPTISEKIAQAIHKRISK